MANHLKMATVHTIYTLLKRGWSRRRIARTLGIDRETVARYARLAREAAASAPAADISKPARASLGSEGPSPPVHGLEADSKPAKAPPGSVLDAPVQGSMDTNGASTPVGGRPSRQPVEQV